MYLGVCIWVSAFGCLYLGVCVRAWYKLKINEYDYIKLVLSAVHNTSPYVKKELYCYTFRFSIANDPSITAKIYFVFSVSLLRKLEQTQLVSLRLLLK